MSDRVSKMEAFQKMKEVRKQEKKEESNRGSYTPAEYEEIAYVGLERGKQTTVRLTGFPIQMRQDSTDPKLVNISMIKDDSDKTMRVIFPDKSENKDWILYKVMNKVMEYTYVKETNSKLYKHSSTHPLVYERVAKNSKPKDAKGYSYENGWKPSGFVIWNVIDRMDDWCKQNNHTKLLSKRVSFGQDGTAYFDAGIGKMLYNSIIDDIVEFNGNWEDYDVVLEKLDVDPFYKALHSIDDAKKIFDPTAKAAVVQGALTNEELAYEKYDLDKLFKITSYQKILKRLGLFIQQVDKAFSTNFYPELVTLVEAEKVEWEKNNPTELVDNHTPINQSTVETNKGTVENMVQPPVRQRPAAKVESSVFDINNYKSVYKNIEALTNEEKAYIIGIADDQKLGFTFTSDAGMAYACSCGVVVPEKITTCYNCGAKFE